MEIAEQAEIEIPSEISNVSDLTPYAVQTRYLGYWEDITETEVDEAIQLAESFIQWAKELFKG